jgi:riboflavin synthase
VSLTVVECNPTSFSVSLVGITQAETTLGGRKAGDIVNLEVDILAKYVDKLSRGESGITKEFLTEHGFM